MQQQKERFPQSGCSLDTVFCFFHNHRNPGGSGEGLCTRKTFADADTHVGTNLMAEEAHACLTSIQTLLHTAHSGSLAYHCMINQNGAHKSEQLVHTLMQRNVCFLHYTPCRSILLHLGYYEYSSYPVPPAPDCWLQECLFLDCEWGSFQ